MSADLLRISGLRTYFRTPEGLARAVDGVSLAVRPGETYAVVGESGCGKSVTGLSIMGLVPVPSGCVAGGRIDFKGRNLLSLAEHERRRVRGKEIAMIFQEPMTSLNPVFTVGYQIREAILLHRPAERGRSRELSVSLLDQVRIPDPERAYASYPHQLSGGMRQRAMIAMALAGRPDLLIADEPTTALDVTIQDQILALLADLQKELGMAVLLITHNLGIVRESAGRVGVMYAGTMVEEAPAGDLFRDPRHPYTVKLLESLPAESKRRRELSTIPGSVPSALRYSPGCRFSDRCPAVMPVCRLRAPATARFEDGHAVACHLYDPAFEAGRTAAGIAETPRAMPAVPPASGTVLEAARVRIHFPVTRGVFQRTVGHVKAVDGVSLSIPRGSTAALVGESGCGKTTLGKGLLRLLPLTSGSVRFEGEDVAAVPESRFRSCRRRMQMIFQDPYSSLDPRMTVREIVGEGLRVHALDDRDRRVGEMLDLVGLGADSATRYPHEFSGGQRQRIGIARALAVGPSFVVCDEATSALDVSVQAQILNLLTELRGRLGLTYMFITHDLGLVEYFSDFVNVMYLGRIVERGTIEEVFREARHPYTRALLASVPRIASDRARKRAALEGDVPSPVNPPPGCHFHPRCPDAMALCRSSEPARTSFSDTHDCTCHLYD